MAKHIQKCDRCKKIAPNFMPVKLGEPHYSVKMLICKECWGSWANLLDKQASERSDFLLKRNKYAERATE